MNDDVSISETIKVTGNATLCLNGRKLSISNVNRGIEIEKGASLTLCDCQTEQGTLEIKANAYGIYCYGDFTMTGGNLAVSWENYIDDPTMLYGIYANSWKVNITVTGGSIKAAGPLDNEYSCYAIVNETVGTTTLSGDAAVSIEARGYYSNVHGVRVIKGTLYLKDDARVIANASNTGTNTIGIYSIDSTVCIYGGTVTAESAKKDGIGIQGNEAGSIINVSGGTVIGSTYGVTLSYGHYLRLGGSPRIAGEKGTDVYLWSPDTTNGSISAHDSEEKAYSGDSETPLRIGRSGSWNIGDVVISKSLEEHCDIFALVDAGDLALRHKNDNIIVDEKVVYTKPELTEEKLTDISPKKDLVSKPGTVNKGFEFQYALGVDETTEPDESAFSPTPPVGDEAGDYYVWWRILDGDGAIDEPPTYLGMVTIHLHDHFSKTWLQDKEKDQHYKSCDVKDCNEEVEGARGNHTWEQESEDKDAGTRTYVCSVCGLKRDMEGDQRVVSGKVVQHDGKTNAAGATVTLKKGSKELGTAVTDSEGNYVFTGVEPGIYDVVVEYEMEGTTITTTVLETVTADADVDMETVKLNSKDVNSTLDVKKGSDTPAIVVGGLDEEVQEHTSSSSTVTLAMSVEGLAGSAAEGNAEIKQINEAGTADHVKLLEYLDLSLELITQSGSEKKTEDIHETNKLLTVVAPIPEGWPSPDTTNYVVYRFHGDKVDVLEKEANSAGEYIETKLGNVVIHAKNFSVYAIGYRLSEVKLPQDVSNGTVTADKQFVSPGEKVTITVTPKDGYQVDSFSVKDASGKEVALTDNKDGTYTFTQPAGDVTVAASFVLKQEPAPSTPGSENKPGQYPVQIPSQGIYGHGSVSASPASADPGDRVTLTVTPDAGYYLDALVVRDLNGNRVTLTYRGNYTYTFIQPVGAVSVYAAFALVPQPGTSTPDPAPTTYSITLPEKVEGGTVTTSAKTAVEGEKVTLTVKAKDGYHLDTIAVLDKDGKTITLKDNGNGTYTYTMPKGAVTVKATFVKCASLAFPDLDPTAWYHEHTDYVIDHDLMNGNDQGLFVPNGMVTRAQMVTLLWNLQGKPVVNYYMTFPDVDQEAWYAEAIRWATSEQVVSGYDSGSFGPNDTITREQMATMLYQYEQKYGGGGFTGTWMLRLPFTDLDQISDWAYEGTAWCYMNKVISGKEEDRLNPKGQATRTEMAAILTQYLTLK